MSLFSRLGISAFTSYAKMCYQSTSLTFKLVGRSCWKNINSINQPKHRLDKTIPFLYQRKSMVMSCLEAWLTSPFHFFLGLSCLHFQPHEQWQSRVQSVGFHCQSHTLWTREVQHLWIKYNPYNKAQSLICHTSKTLMPNTWQRMKKMVKFFMQYAQHLSLVRFIIFVSTQFLSSPILTRSHKQC